MRVLVTGMGGELGSRVAALLEQDDGLVDVLGLDVDPPRRRLRRSHFHRVDPRDRRKVVPIVADFAPQVVVHAGVYEPDARAAPRAAAELTSAATLTVLGAAAETGALEHVVLRSGIEVYGRRRNAATVPDESVPPDPTSPFGRSLLEVERTAAAAANAAGVPVTAVRLAPVVGPHAPSPLGRLLRLPVVPFALLADPSFTVVHQEDAAAALVAAVGSRHDGPVNVVAPGAVTVAQAARIGGRVPFGVIGPGWVVANRVTDLFGTPVPDHLLELLRRGRAADGRSAHGVLGVAARHTACDVIRAVYEWAPVTPLQLVRGEAA